MIKPKHLVSSSDIDKAGYDEIFRRSMKFIKEGVSPELMPGKIIATLFFQPSTRTMNGFQAALLRAGGGWVGVMGEQGISMEKGESFDDTIREYSSFADVIALRHPDDDSSERAAKVSRVPVINCGGGSKEHAVAPSMVLAVLGMYLKRSLQGAKKASTARPKSTAQPKPWSLFSGCSGSNL